jgi:hypothetical protein
MVDVHYKQTLYSILSSQAQVHHHIKFLTLLLDSYGRPIILFKVFFFEVFSKEEKRSYCDLEFFQNFLFNIFFGFYL